MNNSGDNHQSSMNIVSFARSSAIETAYSFLSAHCCSILITVLIVPTQQ